MHRFYCPKIDFSQKIVSLTDPKEIHHLKNVLRLKKGDPVYLFNDNKEQVQGEIFFLAGQEVKIQIQRIQTYQEPTPSIVLACAIPKKGKFEVIVEKTTELGVDEIIPLLTERTEIKIHAPKWENKLKRFETTAINASKQSKRYSVPRIHPAMDFLSALNGLIQTSVVVIPSLCGKPENILKMFSQIQRPAKISFLIGPEGDFSAKEYALAKEKGALSVSLGQNILKVETAAISAVTAAQLFYRNA